MNEYDDQPLHRLDPTYLEHYGLEEPPFSAMVDERFYFSTAEASQRLSLLVHMTQYSDMVLMVLGDEGMGKTTLLHIYIQNAHDNWHICRINANAMMDKGQLLFRIAEDFGLETLPADTAELQELLYDKLTQLHQNGVLPVIIIDDAHELSVDAISQLFIMAEIKAGDTPMVHIVLFADPGIEKTINASNVRKIRERLGHTFELQPYDEVDTAEYILSRLTVAGLVEPTPFSPKVIRQIHKQSHGNPARINELAHIALDDAQGGNEEDFTDEPYDHDDEAPRKQLITPLRAVVVLTIASLAGLGIWQQDRINQLFELPPTETASGPAPEPEVEREAEAPQDSPFAKLKEKLITLKQEPASVEKTIEPQPGKGKPLDLSKIEDPAIAAQLTNPTTEPAGQATTNKSSGTGKSTATAPIPQIERIEPQQLVASTDKQTITIHGRHFSPDTEVTLSWAGNQKTLPPSRRRLIGDTQIQFDINTGTQPDEWQIRLNTPRIGQSNQMGFTVTAGTPASPTTLATTDATQWLNTQPADNLTLQLLGSHSLKPIDDYIAEHQLDKQAVVYKTTHQGKDWYVLFYGSFATPQQAQQSIDRLPSSAKANKPWIRSFASIRKQSPETSTAAPTRDSKPAPTGKVPQLSDIKAHEAWLWTQDPNHYTLQLLGTQNVDNIKQFIEQHQLRGKVVYYHTQRDNQDWYALLYGVYPNDAEAKTAVNRLPTPIRELSPWVRNFSAIHAEMGKPTR